MCYWFVPLIAAGVSAVGQGQAGADAQEAADRQAQLGELQAQDELSRGGIEEQRYRRQLAQIVGAQRTAVGNRNVQQSGTALDLLSDTNAIGEEDILTLRNESARTAWGYRTGADETRRYGRSVRTQANYGATASLISGGAQAYGMWAKA